MLNVLWILPLLWLAVVSAVLLYYRRDLLALWREPVLRHPVMIIESDDWGAGPVEAQAAALNRLVDILTRYRDSEGRHSVMTLALVLAVPDGPAIRRDGRYHRIELDDPRFAPVLAAIERGCKAGVFALQLHGLEHYWPANLMAVDDSTVKNWLIADEPQATEKLPSHLQSRWVDATVLPSRPLDRAAVEAAVSEEVRLFERVFGEKPRVAVPPTFVWRPEVERAWAREGIEFVVTPGLRSACRNADGIPDCDSGPFRNGERGEGVTYLVRDDYFEPERGHQAERALAALAAKTRQGRPCLLETHRSNFIGDPVVAEQALHETGRLLDQALREHPELRFLGTAELARTLHHENPVWVDERIGARLSAWCSRVVQLPGLGRWTKLAGVSWLLRWAQARRALLGTSSV